MYIFHIRVNVADINNCFSPEENVNSSTYNIKSEKDFEGVSLTYYIFFLLYIKLLFILDCVNIYLNYSETNNEIVGHRVVDIAYVFKQIQNSNHDGSFGCNFLNMDFVNEVRYGAYSDFWYKCKMCNIKQKMSSVQNSPSTNWSINKSIVNTSIAIGNNYLLFTFCNV